MVLAICPSWDRAVHTAAEQRRVRCIDNRIHALLRDVAFDDFDSTSHLIRFISLVPSPQLRGRYAKERCLLRI